MYKKLVKFLERFLRYMLLYKHLVFPSKVSFFTKSAPKYAYIMVILLLEYAYLTTLVGDLDLPNYFSFYSKFQYIFIIYSLQNKHHMHIPRDTI